MVTMGILEHLDERPAGEAAQQRQVEERQCERREDEMAQRITDRATVAGEQRRDERRTAPERRQHVQADGKEENEEDTEPEHGHRDAELGKQHRHGIDQPAAPAGRDQPQRDTDPDGQDEREDREFECRRERRGDQP
jgi:hypothetical protein